ncbi:hypothetical protein [Sphingomicrobium astaxanthinifaciens]|nr:hypothetical protein [Sphingomicrobium astaxanthinifaciens]
MSEQPDDKAKRLAEALRANLRRRKGQAKAQAGDSKKPAESGD